MVCLIFRINIKGISKKISCYSVCSDEMQLATNLSNEGLTLCEALVFCIERFEDLRDLKI